MTLPLVDIPVPIKQWPGGEYRIGDSRVLLEVFIRRYAVDGYSAADLQEAFPELDAAQVAAVLAYYLAHRNEVDAYVAAARQRAEESLARDRALHPQPSRREVLRRRRRSA